MVTPLNRLYFAAHIWISDTYTFWKVVGDDGKGYEYNSARLGDSCVVR
jgi:hypothetical protein